MQPILVIDDDDQARSVVRRALDRVGYDVVEAVDGEEGTRLALEVSPALVVTDIIMPNKEGLQVIRELHDRHPELPIIAMSGGSHHLSPDAILRLAQCFGARATLFKPFALADLVSTVRAAIGTPSDKLVSG
jgi:DNA-binding NtrC family response regulator